ncbi:MAG: response regulator [Desulfobulbaceae bacterium]|jgi:two-component system chemotaxis response regulator CheY|nr:response regulator [Desulfobulbaceae bacterium]
MKTLIVEDDNMNRELLVEFFSEYGTVQSAENGFKALDLFQDAHLQDAPFDLICMDIMMPDLDGQEALKEIRELETDKGLDSKDIVKVLMMTGLTDRENVTTAYVDGGCHGYLTKPVATKDIVALLARLGLVEATEEG